MKKITLFLFLISQAVFSQSSWVKGYVVDQMGDSLSGYINDRDWRLNPAEVYFKADLSQQKITTYTPANTLRFGINSKDTYISKQVSISADPIRTENLLRTSDPVPLTKNAMVFLRLLSRGAVNLYAYQDAIKEHFYIENKTQIQELIWTRRLNPDNMAVSIDRYKGTLSLFLTENCGQKLSDNIADLRFEELAIQTLVDRYNVCVNPQAKALDRSNQVALKPRWMVSAGAQQVSAKSSVVTIENGGVNLAFGVGIELNSSRNFRLNSAIIEAQFTSQSVTTLTPTTTSQPFSRNTYNWSTLRLLTMYRRYLSRKKIQPFIEAGILMGTLLNTKTEPQTGLGYITLDYGFVGGVGVKSGNFSVQSRIQNSKAPIPFFDPVFNTSVMASYYF